MSDVDVIFEMNYDSMGMMVTITTMHHIVNHLITIHCIAYNILLYVTSTFLSHVIINNHA